MAKGCLWLPLFLAVAASALGSQAPLPPSSREPPPRIVAVGDLHGDLRQAIAALTLAKLVSVTLHGQGGPEGVHWSGGRAVLVQIGDLVDKGPDSTALVIFFERLRAEARSAGGEVVVLLGNHEALALQGETLYAHEDEIKHHGGVENRNRVFGPGGAIGKVLATRPAVWHWRDSVFVHAGLLAEHAGLGIAGVNAKVAAALAAEEWMDPVLRRRGPLWTREQLRAAERGDCDPLAEGLAALSAAEGRKFSRMVVGHSVRPDGRVGEYCDGKLWAIDVGISNWTQGMLAAIELTPKEQSDGVVVQVLAPAGPLPRPRVRKPVNWMRVSRERERVVDAERSQSVILIPFLGTVVMPLMLAAGAAGFTCAARGLRRGLLRLRPKPSAGMPPSVVVTVVSTPPVTKPVKEQSGAAVRSRSGDQGQPVQV
eukprot:TRINITY_DN4394_c0_g3_i1.p1 TRINITY_DN4394_c0_g3~~TRINITY_DN4394_c0_g3_i1.p1  ORF type:complete len:426 (+),score=123.87 TRINITY_DN4394_c0_g3_i1:61-1338(+)